MEKTVAPFYRQVPDHELLRIGYCLFQQVADQAGALSNGENHDLTRLVTFWRDASCQEQRDVIEKVLHAFIVRRKTGLPCTVRQLREEFQVPD